MVSASSIWNNQEVSQHKFSGFWSLAKTSYQQKNLEMLFGLCAKYTLGFFLVVL